MSYPKNAQPAVEFNPGHYLRPPHFYLLVFSAASSSCTLAVIVALQWEELGCGTGGSVILGTAGLKE